MSVRYMPSARTDAEACSECGEPHGEPWDVHDHTGTRTDTLTLCSDCVRYIFTPRRLWAQRQV